MPTHAVAPLWLYVEEKAVPLGRLLLSPTFCLYFLKRAFIAVHSPNIKRPNGRNYQENSSNCENDFVGEGGTT